MRKAGNIPSYNFFLRKNEMKFAYNRCDDNIQNEKCNDFRCDLENKKVIFINSLAYLGFIENF